MSLDLDQRQRAMLEEMRVRVWWPQPGTAAVAIDTKSGSCVRPEPPVLSVVEGFGGPADNRLGPDGNPMAEPSFAAGAPARPQARLTPAARSVPTDGGTIQALAELGTIDWPVLASTIAGCTACQLCSGRKAPVFTSEPSPRQADWLVVGEPPDEQEERAGTPFAGQAGQLLDNMLRALQLTRDGTGSAGARLTNIVKCRTAPVRNPQADELAICAMYLRREIALVQPKVIVAMGRFAAMSLLGDSGPELASLPFGKLRGQVHRYHGVPVVVTHHPGRLLRAREDKAGAWADLCLAQSVARQGQTSRGAEPIPPQLI